MSVFFVFVITQSSECLCLATDEVTVWWATDTVIPDPNDLPCDQRMSEAASLKHWPPCMIVDIPTSWRRNRSTYVCVLDIWVNCTTVATPSCLLFGGSRLCVGQRTMCCMWVQIGSTWQIRWNGHCGIVNANCCYYYCTPCYMQLCSDRSYSRICRTICTWQLPTTKSGQWHCQRNGRSPRSSHFPRKAILNSVQITEQLLLSPTQARSFFGSYWRGSE